MENYIKRVDMLVSSMHTISEISRKLKDMDSKLLITTAITLTLLVLTFCSHIWATGYSTTIMQSPSNPLNGKHLRVIWTGWSGNPKGLPGPLKGGVILECLTRRFNFTYEMVRVTESSVGPSTNGKGLFNYLRNQQCDLLLQDVVSSIAYGYRQAVDITVPWVYTTAAILTHIPDDTLNIEAVIKPFQWPIWLGVGISIVCVIFVLNFLQYQEEQFKTGATHGNNRLMQKLRNGEQYIYVFGTLLAQGGPCTSSRLSFRLVAGAWVLATFIFVQAYNSTLFTYLVTPINNPLINSPYDIPERKVHLLIKKGGSTDLFLSNIKANNTSFILYKKLAEILNSSSDSRCYPVSQCVSLLTPGSNNVYMDGINYHKDIIREEFQKTGKCNYQILAKEGFSTVMSSFALPKNSEYTKTVSQGLLEIMQAGLLDNWEEWFRPMPPQCQGNIKSFKPPDSKTLKMKDHPPALSLKNLTGAFIVLFVGFGLSLLAFLCEKIISNPNHQRHRSKKVRNNQVNFHKDSAVNAEGENDIYGKKKINQTEATTNIDDEFENQSIQIGQDISDSNDRITVDIHNRSTS